MKTFISTGDIVDTYYKIKLKGLKIFTDRFGWSTISRIKNVWENSDNPPTNWWSIPEIQKRWNLLITGDSNKEYQDYLVEKYCKGKNNLKLISPGCGNGTKEIKFSKFNNFKLINAFDIAPSNIKVAKEHVKKLGHKNVNFFVDDVLKYDFGHNEYNIVVFDSILHHIKKLDYILDKIYNSLKPDGILVINEYVGPNRFQWNKEQLKISNKILKNLPVFYRKRWRSENVKCKIYRPGLLRMFLSDPSEAVNSENILPEIRKRFEIMEEKPYGGNILHLVLKDISHNFTEDSIEGNHILKGLFEIEDNFVKNGRNSDFVFGVYGKSVNESDSTLLTKYAPLAE